MYLREGSRTQCVAKILEGGEEPEDDLVNYIQKQL